MDARELTKHVNALEDKVFFLQKENEWLKERVFKLELYLGDHINKKLVNLEGINGK